MAGIPSDIVLRNLTTPPVKGLTAPLIATAPALRDGTRPASNAPGVPTFTTSATSNSITAIITDDAGATSYEIRVDGGTEQSGLTATNLDPSQTYAVEVRGINQYGTGDWSTPVNETTAAGGGGGATPYFEDDFSSGDLSKTTGGFTWSSIGGDVQVTTGNPRTGTHSLAFTYGPDPSGDYDHAELKFNLKPAGTTTLTEFWVEWYLYIPNNFTLRPDGWGYNNKLFVAYAELYSDPNNIQWVGEYGRDSNDEATMRAVCMTGAGCVASGSQPNKIFTAIHKGRWLQMRGYFKAGNGDGVTKIWRDGDLVWTVENYTHHAAGGNNYWRKGYLLGTANTGFTEKTVLNIDNVKFYDTDPGWGL